MAIVERHSISWTHPVPFCCTKLSTRSSCWLQLQGIFPFSSNGHTCFLKDPYNLIELALLVPWQWAKSWRDLDDGHIQGRFQRCRLTMSWEGGRFWPVTTSSANHTCLISLSSRWWISSVMATAYIVIASGSPWVVPSWERSTSPSMKTWTSSW